MTGHEDQKQECAGHHGHGAGHGGGHGGGHGKGHGKHQKPDFYGIASVGERGQIVIPAEARKVHDIKPGDKLIVAGGKGNHPLVLLKAEVLTDKIEHLTKELDYLKAIEEKETE